MRLEILITETRDITLSRQRTTKALIRLRGCAGWSAALLFAYDIRHILSWPGSVCFHTYSYDQILDTFSKNGSNHCNVRTNGLIKTLLWLNVVYVVMCWNEFWQKSLTTPDCFPIYFVNTESLEYYFVHSKRDSNLNSYSWNLLWWLRMLKNSEAGYTLKIFKNCTLADRVSGPRYAKSLSYNS